jgi:23S rRNA pseudouridine1911/1915/1917 synthase
MKITNEHETAQRVDVLLARANPGYSRAALAKLFDMGKINKGAKLLKAGDKIQPGLAFDADISPINAAAEEITMPIIFEDENVIVVDKPTGVISHARGKYWDEASVASFVRSKVADATGERAGIVHRLDRATSGVMICAKNADTMSFLQKQFSQRKVKKQYTAIVSGLVEPKEALIDVPLARNPKDPKSFRPDELGRSATTMYTVVSRAPSHRISDT